MLIANEDYRDVNDMFAEYGEEEEEEEDAEDGARSPSPDSAEPHPRTAKPPQSKPTRLPPLPPRPGSSSGAPPRPSSSNSQSGGFSSSSSSRREHIRQAVIRILRSHRGAVDVLTLLKALQLEAVAVKEHRDDIHAVLGEVASQRGKVISLRDEFF